MDKTYFFVTSCLYQNCYAGFFMRKYNTLIYSPMRCNHKSGSQVNSKNLNYFF